MRHLQSRSRQSRCVLVDHSTLVLTRIGNVVIQSKTTAAMGRIWDVESQPIGIGHSAVVYSLEDDFFDAYVILVKYQRLRK